MRHVDLLASVLSAVRKGTDDHALRLKAAEERAEARAQALEDKVGKLSADIADLADATRAVLLRQRDPQPAAGKPAAAAVPAAKEKM